MLYMPFLHEAFNYLLIILLFVQTWAAQMLSKSSKDKAFSFITNRKIFSNFSTYCKAGKTHN